MIETLAEVIAYVLMELVFIGIFYWPGWLILPVLTLGRYPPSRNQEHNKGFAAGMALVVSFIVLTIYYSHFVP